MLWRELPPGARTYILYHTLVTPTLLAWLLLPLYLMKTGYSVLEVGAFFTAANLLSVPLTYALGRWFNRWDLKRGLVAVDLLDGTAYLSYGLAHGALAPVWLFLGRTLEMLSSVFYPLYPAYEQIVYPADRYERILAWHLRLPLLAKVISFPLLGYLLGYVFPQPGHFRAAFLAFGAYTVLMAAYIWVLLPSVGVKERVEPMAFVFRAGEFRLLLAFETLVHLAWGIVPELVLINYVVNALGKTLFEVTLIVAVYSLGSVLATYLGERIPAERGFYAIAWGLVPSALFALVMAAAPPFSLVLLAYLAREFGDAFWFPFYRAWLFRLVPRERASEYHAALSSYRRLVALFAPGLAGALASLHATLPYAVSFILFVSVGIVFGLAARGNAPGSGG